MNLAGKPYAKLRFSGHGSDIVLQIGTWARMCGFTHDGFDFEWKGIPAELVYRLACNAAIRVGRAWLVKAGADPHAAHGLFCRHGGGALRMGPREPQRPRSYWRHIRSGASRVEQRGQFIEKSRACAGRWPPFHPMAHLASRLLSRTPVSERELSL